MTTTRAVARARGALQAAAFGALVTVSDLLPPSVRYGYVHRLSRILFTRPLAAVASPSTPSAPTAPPDPAGAGPTEMTCVLATFHLDVGGVGAVVEMLARHLGAQGVRPVVVCEGDGTRAARLRASGIEVISVDDGAAARAAIAAVRPDVVELHSAPAWLERAAMDARVPLVTVMHNTEIHFTAAQWRRFSALMERSFAGVAVSETVREFHARRVSPEAARRMVVIPNGAPQRGAASSAERSAARGTLGAAVGVDLGDDRVVVCLARYDAQKNIAGTVASFLAAAEELPGQVRLVIAGDPSDWAEYWRADGVRRRSRLGDRVHLLGNSDATTLLHAADAFVLNSFFEGWPVAATEAAAVGLPLLLSDVGGARELVGSDSAGSVLVANASGPAADVSDARVAAARRRSNRQDNAAELAVALRTVIERRDEVAAQVRDGSSHTAAAMARAHGALVKAATAGHPVSV
ncbi:glycosyl transferase group 1 [Xylanimonas cellulosilytica DSM 15894]|uniref:Glycosyl transferase group 1 n=1 Tax=Xylanimonas cellulosilytica (strain DSM 15894 / JCM 12276 / CECT 5975 / KCTC 9989 / LMG 20990 / NBRC 107835 / XIL07) TaxID=446471 RepID=D1BXS1_XYLCX|nr:glycosyltransferase family 4 protein [Xylanimonas cellulosilytica]ACZ31712.1 glycosyl transferase group 1 [Xylanimonas cellulosilytica DSM 15894]